MDEERLVQQVLARRWLSEAQLSEARTRAESGGLLAYLAANFLRPEQVLALQGSPPAAPGKTLRRLPGVGEWVQDRYQIVRQLGRGAMGAVFVAKDTTTDQEVALKVQIGDAKDALARFRIEAEALAKLRHPGVVEVRDFGLTPAGLAFLAMELVPGKSLADVIKTRGCLPPRRAVELALQLAQALAHVHAAGILHRDLKPANVLVTPDGRAVLTDFGLAKIVDQNQHLSSTGQLLGTPAYMAPELASGQVRQVGPATEVYGLGATLYDMLAGRPPFADMGHYQLLVAVYSSNPEPPSHYQAGIDARLDTICMTCLAKAPGERYPDMASLIPDLKAYAAVGPTLPPDSPSRGPWVAALLALVLLLALIGGGVSALRDPVASPTPTPAELQTPALRWEGPARVYLWQDRELAVTLEASGPVQAVLARRSVELQPDPEAPGPGTTSAPLRLRGESGPLDLWPVWEGTLEPGSNRVPLSIKALAALGSGECTLVAREGKRETWPGALSLAVELAPAWLIELPVHERPPAIPPGVRALPTSGEFLNEIDGSVLVWVPPGEATLFDGAEGFPAKLETGVFLGRNEVTWDQFFVFRRAVGLARLFPKDGEPEGKASAVSDWFTAQDYCRWAGARLPSELEWSRAAWGSETNWKRATLNWSEQERQPSDGEQGSRSAFGCLDMLGNLRELTRDPDHDIGEAIPNRLKLSRGDVGAIVMRGGAWDERPKRRTLKLISRKPVGFRVCLDPFGRTREVKEIEWSVSVGRFKPRQPPAPDISWRPPPRQDEVQPLTKQTWTLPHLNEPWPFEVLARHELVSRSLSGLHLRATTTLSLSSGSWLIATSTDDGIRVRLSEGGKQRTILERWDHHPPTLDRARFQVEGGSGPVTLEVEYCNIAGGRALFLTLSPE